MQEIKIVVDRGDKVSLYWVEMSDKNKRVCLGLNHADRPHEFYQVTMSRAKVHQLVSCLLEALER